MTNSVSFGGIVRIVWPHLLGCDVAVCAQNALRSAVCFAIDLTDESSVRSLALATGEDSDTYLV